MLRIVLPRLPLRKVVPTVAMRVRSAGEARIGFGLQQTLLASGAKLEMDEAIRWRLAPEHSPSLQVGILRRERGYAWTDGLLVALADPQHSTNYADPAMEQALFPLRFSEQNDLRNHDGLDCITSSFGQILHRRGHLSWILGTVEENNSCIEKMAMSAIAISLGTDHESVRYGLLHMKELVHELEVV